MLTVNTKLALFNFVPCSVELLLSLSCVCYPSYSSYRWQSDDVRPLWGRSRLVSSVSTFDSLSKRCYISFRSFQPDILSILYNRGAVPRESTFLYAYFRFRRPPAVFSALFCPQAAPCLPCGCRRRCTGFPSASSGP